MSKIAKRFGFKRTTTSDDFIHGAAVEHVNSSDAGSDQFTKKDEAGVTANTSADVEIEANNTLEDIKAKHRWDPNLPSDILEDLNDATATHNVGKELNLVDGLLENSPYPEVQSAVRNVSIFSYLTRIVLIKLSMMRMFLRTPSVRGSLV
jgi:hypothetical protein